MTVTLTQKEEDELWIEAEQNSACKLALEPFEVCHEIPRQLGKGHVRHLEVYPELWLTIELMALQLAPILADRARIQASPRLRTETIDRIYCAQEILLSRLENPPSLLDLAKLVGVSDRTLRRGFQELFNTTVFAYLTSQRMEKAKCLLRERHLTVAEVAVMVGYSNQSHFTAAFKRQFGITPRDCLAGKLGCEKKT
ncbi:MAG: helix-turn-helix transcriptional regulator [Hydrococcus sp. RU_2_2]|nr:helix-turn-helix transcriptional regulator [Hydrococcus sp. RU_2_2]NJP20139.1 helix-turn-helix transcriptional regulator [Hydrococcus sp. CRU_1_1]